MYTEKISAHWKKGPTIYRHKSCAGIIIFLIGRMVVLMLHGVPFLLITDGLWLRDTGVGSNILDDGICYSIPWRGGFIQIKERDRNRLQALRPF